MLPFVLDDGQHTTRVRHRQECALQGRAQADPQPPAELPPPEHFPRSAGAQYLNT